MALDLTNIKDYIYNPNLIQKEILDAIGNYNNGQYVISDPTNPFMLLMEACAVNSASAVQECNNIIRKKYISLAKKDEDIYHHFYEDILTNLFCQPAEAVIDFYIPVMDIRNFGYRPAGADYRETTIPVNSTISVLDTTYVILNDIVVRLYDNGETYVEQLLNPDNDLAYDDIGTLDSGIMHTKQTTPVLFFRTKVKQVTLQSIVKNIVPTAGFNEVIKIKDDYVFSNVFYKNSSTGNQWKALRKTHSDEYISPTSPCCYISVYDKQIMYRIPDPYLLEGMISGVVKIDVYTSKGKLYEPINRLDTDQFSISLGDINKNSSTLSSSKINIICHSQYLVNGGKNAETFDNLKANLIEQGYVTQNLPITDKQISTIGSFNGYNIVKNVDVLTNREYLALKSLPDFTSKYVYAKQDVFFNTVHLNLKSLTNNSYVSISDEVVIIKSNAIFKLDNGQVTIIDEVNRQTLNTLQAVPLIQHMKTTKYFYTPYYYFIRNDGLNTLTSVYDLDLPVIDSYRILEKNNNIDVSVNVNQYAIEKTAEGYMLYFTIVGNDKFDNLDPSKFYIQATVPLFNGTQYAYIDGGYDADLAYYYIPLLSDMNINDEDMLRLSNGTSTVSIKRIPLSLDITIHLCTGDPSIVDSTGYLQAQVKKKGLTILSKEQFSVTLGYKYDNMYVNGILTYGKDKYKLYEEDIPVVRSENVYDIDPLTGSAFTCNASEDKHSLIFNIKYKKGDKVLDEDGNPVMLHRKGETKLDESGLPIIDVENGLEYYIDVCMLELEFRLANTSDYQLYLKDTLQVLRNYLTTEIPSINNQLLENTKLKYRSYKSINNVYLQYGKATTATPYLVQPVVTLYFVNTRELSIDVQDSYRTVIGNIINKYLDNTQIKLQDVKDEIKNKVSENIVSVKLEGVDSQNSEMVILANPTKKLTIAKTLDLDINNSFVVKYDIQLNIVYV